MMAGQQLNGRRNGERAFIGRLWTAAALIAVGGFILRALGHFLARSDLRLLGVGLLGVGIAIAVLGWLGEKWFNTRPTS